MHRCTTVPRSLTPVDIRILYGGCYAALHRCYFNRIHFDRLAMRCPTTVTSTAVISTALSTQHTTANISLAVIATTAIKLTAVTCPIPPVSHRSWQGFTAVASTAVVI